MSKNLQLSVKVPELLPIDVNFNELKTSIANTMTIYKNKVYTEDDRKLAKSDRADLNRFRTALEDKRKEVKKAWNEPYLEFEGKVKELVSLVSEPIDLIDQQVTEFEKKIIDEKLAQAVAYYTEQAELTKLDKILSWEKVMQKNFYNLTKTLPKIKDDIDQILLKTVNDWTLIEGMKSPYEYEVKNAYKQSLDLQAAMQLEQKLREEAEKKTAYEAEREARAKALAAAKKEVTPKTLFIESEATELKQEAQKVYHVAFKVSGTADELKALSNFLKTNNYTYEQLKGV